MHSLGHFFAEAFENITHADSRLWRTIALLLFRPGRLTWEFFAGHRARYLPAVRLYLVVSVLFFSVSAALPGAKMSSPGVVYEVNGEKMQSVDCSKVTYSGPFATYFGERIRAGCAKLLADKGKGLASAMAANIPRAMFLFLPLFAAIARLMYWRPRRHYVEHLLLLVHNHSFMFLGLTLSSALASVLPESLSSAFEGLFMIYALYYMFRSMRVMYAQSRLLTTAKYLLLLGAYLVLGAAMMGITAIWSVASL
ncbi:MAG: DUF3667 domain-containing protein [Steroidobacteraceae bacterium]